MKTFLRYFYEILSQFFSGFIAIFKGIIDGFGRIFNIKAYIQIAKSYKGDFGVGFSFVRLDIYLYLSP